MAKKKEVRKMKSRDEIIEELTTVISSKSTNALIIEKLLVNMISILLDIRDLLNKKEV